MKIKRPVRAIWPILLFLCAVITTDAVEPSTKHRVKTAIASASVAELPATASELILGAAKRERSDIIAEIVRQAIYKNPSSGPQIVAALSKAAPDLAGMIVLVACEMDPNNAARFVHLANAAAPASKLDIAAAARAAHFSPFLLDPGCLCEAARRPANPTMPSSGLSARASAGGVPTGSVIQTRQPINTSSGGAGNGFFPTNPPTSVGTGCAMCDYTKPRNF